MIEVTAVEAGQRIERVTGEICTVVENPRDGLWLVVTVPGSAETEVVFVAEIGSVLPPEGS